MHNIADLKAQIAANLKVIRNEPEASDLLQSLGDTIGARIDRHLQPQSSASLHGIYSSRCSIVRTTARRSSLFRIMLRPQ